MLLHIVNKSPAASGAFAACLDRARDGASVLLIDDGVYAALAGGAVEAACARLNVYALTPDVDARGLTGRIAGDVRLVDYDGFVDLVVSHSSTHSWT